MSTMRAWCLPSLVAIAVTSVATPRSAFAVPPSNDAEWQKAYEAAARLLDAGKPVMACPLLEDVAVYRAGAGVLLALGDCYAATGQYVLALARYEGALGAAHEASTDRSTKEQLARAGVAAMEAKVARIEVTLSPGAPDGTRVRMDGLRVQDRAVLTVDPGTHELRVTAPGHATATVRVVVSAGERVVPRLEPGAAIAREDPRPVAPAPGVDEESGPVPDAPPRPTPLPAASGRPEAAPRVAEPARPRSLVLPGISLGVGAIGLTMMGVAAARLVEMKGTISLECDADKACSQRGLDAVDTSKTLNGVGTAGAVVTGLGLAGFVTWLVWPKLADGPKRATIAPILGGGHVGGAARWAF